MNRFLVLLLLPFFASCAHLGKSTPRATVAPVTQSNAATQTGITESRKHIKQAQDTSKQEAQSLDTVDKDLTKLLNQ